MPAPSEQDAAVEEVWRMNEGNRGDDGLWSLSGDKPFFDVILAKSHVFPPHGLRVPAHIVPTLPRVVVPVVLTHGDKQWHMLYSGDSKRPAIEFAGWKSFVGDNDLEVGDGCIFQVMESRDEILRLRVVILRNTAHLPPELRPRGETPETAIEIE